MNIIVVMSDTFRYDNLSCYGPTSVQTPNLDNFASQAHVFQNAFLGSFPTIPYRLDMMSGRFSFIDHEWCPLPKDTITLQQILSASGVTTQLIADNPHMVEMGFNYERGYDGWEWIRGQETDHWKTSPRYTEVKTDHNKVRSADFLLQSHLRNTAWWKCEEDRFAARSIKSACQWLEENQTVDKFFLHIDLFDPHEPWDPPENYIQQYSRGYTGESVFYPRYWFWKEYLTKEELDRARALYWAEASLVDHWFGVLMNKIDELGMNEDTAVVFLSDHGYLFGEHGYVGKSLISQEGHYEAIRMYDHIRKTPLMIRLPGQTKSNTINSLVQGPDLMPTFQEMAGLIATEHKDGQSRTQALQCGVFYTEDWQYRPETVHGRSLMPLMRAETNKIRDIAVSSNTLIHHTPILAKSAIITEDGWCLHYAGKYENEVRDAAMFINKLTNPEGSLAPTEPALFYLPEDPGEENDLIDQNETLALEIHARYVHWLEELGTPEEHLAGRRDLR